MKRSVLVVFLILLSFSVAQAKVDLVTLPKRDKVQLTIYNSADLTLVRDSRTLTLEKGENDLQFSWAETLIDPTSLEMIPLDRADRIDVTEIVFPPRVGNLGLWRIQSRDGGQSPFEISYLTSGLSWRAFYMASLDPDESRMNLKGYVVISNQSGEDYENAETRLIVGRVHLLDQIADLARRGEPYGRPGPIPPPAPTLELMDREEESRAKPKAMLQRLVVAGSMAPKEIKKEGLSEYFLYTIPGTETIPHGWKKRLLSFESESVPVINLYKYEEEKFGRSVNRFLQFKNDQEHRLGQTPIPGGELKVFRRLDESGGLSYIGESSFKYIPVEEDVELDLGPALNVSVKPVLMDYRTRDYMFNNKHDIEGFNELFTYRVLVKNTRPLPVKIEIKRNFNSNTWNLEHSLDPKNFEKVDLNTVKFTLDLGPESEREFNYTVTVNHGRRAE